jgi:6-phosphogluconolactonase
LPDSFAGENTTPEVRVHPSGRFVYGSNRGHDSIAAFGVSDDHTLTLVAIHPAGGQNPAQLRARQDGSVPAGGEPRLGFPGALPHRPAEGRTH